MNSLYLQIAIGAKLMRHNILLVLMTFALQADAQVTTNNVDAEILETINIINNALADRSNSGFNPAYVAALEAEKRRLEKIQRLREITTIETEQKDTLGTLKAMPGDTPQVLEALNQINNFITPKKEIILGDGPEADSARKGNIPAKPDKSTDEILNIARRQSENSSFKVTFEIVVQSLNERGKLSQFARDVFGLTAASDWGRLSPAVNNILTGKGFTGSRAITFFDSAENYLEVLRQISHKERVTMLFADRDRLVSAVGEEDTKRFLRQVESLNTLGSKEREVFLGILGIIFGGAVAAVACMRTLKLLKRGGL